MRCFSVENPSLIITRGRSSERKSLKSSRYLTLSVFQETISPDIPDIRMAAFRVLAPNKSKAQETLKTGSEKQNQHNWRNLTASMQLQDREKIKMRNNESQEKHKGTVVLYGSVIQINLLDHESENSLFKILPCYKVRSVGDEVQIEDHVIFESEKAKRMYLHTSSRTYNQTTLHENIYEINASVSESGYTIKSHYYAMPNEEEFVKGGSIIRLMHSELECYLVAEGSFANDYKGVDKVVVEEVHLRKRKSEHGILKAPSTSSITYWQIENEKEPLSGRTISWEEPCRIKHLPTRLYLGIVEEAEGYKVVLKNRHTDSNRTDLDTVFKIFPVIQQQTAIQFNSYARIHHPHTDTWLGTQKEKHIRKAFNPNAPGLAKLQWDFAELFQVSASVQDQMNYNDAFAIEKVDEMLIQKFTYVAGVIPIIKAYVKELNFNPQKIGVEKAEEIQQVLKELTDFVKCTHSRMKDNQKLLRNLMILEMVVDILKKFNPAAQDASVHRPVCQACYHLMDAYLQGQSRKNENYLGRFINFFEEQMGMDLHVEQMLTELIRDNSVIIFKYGKNEIDDIIEKLIHSKSHSYFEYLGVLCVCNGQPIPDNQDNIIKKLVKQHGKELFYLTKVYEPVSYGPSAENTKEIKYRKPGDCSDVWHPLSCIASKNGQNSKEFQYLVAQFDLFGKLCKGNNKSAIEVIAKEFNYLTFEEALIGAQDDNLHCTLRCKYVELIILLYVDVGENRAILDELSLSFVYKEISINPYKSAVENQTEALTGVTNEYFPKLKEWILSYVREHKSVFASEIDKNNLSTKVLELLHLLVKYGYYSNQLDINELIPLLISLLDGKYDKPFPDANPDQAELFLMEKRFEDNDENRAIFNMKIKALHIMDLFFNFRIYLRLHHFIYDYKLLKEDVQARIQFSSARLEQMKCETPEQIEHPKEQMPHFKQHILQLVPNFAFLAHEGSNYPEPPEQLKELEIETHQLKIHDPRNENLMKLAVERLKYIFSRSHYDYDSIVPSILMDLSQYQNDKLLHESLHLLGKIYSVEEDLFEKATQAQLLITPESKHIYKKIETILPTLCYYAGIDMNKKQYSDLLHILDQLAIFCQWNDEPHKQNQKILYNTGVFSDVLNLIFKDKSTRQITDDGIKVVNNASLDYDKMQQRKDIVERCLEFLRLLAKDNMTVKVRLFDHMDNLLLLDIAIPQMADLLSEVFTGGRELCLKIKPKQINSVFLLIAYGGIVGRTELLDMLQAVVKVEKLNLPLKRNQTCIIKYFSKMRDKFCDDLLGLEEEKVMRRKELLIHADNHNPALQMLLKLFDLLASCSEGDDLYIDLTCQNVMGISELLQILCMDNLDPLRKKPFVRFLLWVYMDAVVDKIQTDIILSHDSQMWSFLDHVSSLLDGVVIALANLPNDKEKASARCDFTFQSTRIRQNKLTKSVTRSTAKSVPFVTNRNGELFPGLLLYLMEGILPMLKFYYTKYFKPVKITGNSPETVYIEKEVQLSATIACSLMNLADVIKDLLTSQEQWDILCTTTITIIRLPCVEKVIRVDPKVKQNFDNNIHFTIAQIESLKEYKCYYEHEMSLNANFNNFVRNYELAYWGPNTASHQIKSPYEAVYSEFENESLDEKGDEWLPLGKSFQDHVKFYINGLFPNIEIKVDYVKRIVDCLESSYNNLANLDDRERQKQDKNDIRYLQILRTLIHNQVLFVDPEKVKKKSKYVISVQNEIQNLGNTGYTVKRISKLLAHPNGKIFAEVLALLSMLLYNGNRNIQEGFGYLMHTRAENLYINIQQRLQQTVSNNHETRMLLAQYESYRESQRILKEEYDIHQASSRPAVEGGSNPKSALYFCKNQQLDESEISIKSPVLFDDPVDLSTKHQPLLDESYEMQILNRAHTLHDKKELAKHDDENITSLLKFQDTSYIDLSLRVLGLMCDGQYRPMQNFLREQPNNIKTINLVSETCIFLSSFFVDITKDNIVPITTALQTLIKMSMDNFANQRILFNCKIIDTVNNILQTRVNQHRECSLINVFKLKLSAVTLLEVMCEEIHMETEKLVLNIHKSVDITALHETLFFFHDQMKKHDDAESAAFKTYHVLVHLADFEGISLSDIEPKSKNDNTWNYYQKKSRSIEVKYKNEEDQDILATIHFRTHQSDQLSVELIEKATYQVNRNSNSTEDKYRDFLKWMKTAEKNLTYLKLLRKHWYTHMFIYRDLGVWRNRLLFILTLVMNLLLVIAWNDVDLKFDYVYNPPEYDMIDPMLSGYCVASCYNKVVDNSTFTSDWCNRSYCEVDETVVPTVPDIDNYHWFFNTVLYIGGVPHLVLSLFMVISYFLINAPNFVLPDFFYHYILQVKDPPTYPDEEALRILGLQFKSSDKARCKVKRTSTYFDRGLLGLRSQYHVIFLACSILSLPFHGYFYCVCLLHIVLDSDILQRVLRSVTKNARSLLWVGALGLVVLYIYSVATFAFLSNEFHEPEKGSGEVRFCRSYAQCFITVLEYGLLETLGSAADLPMKFKDAALRAVFYDLTFFIIFTTIGMDIVFGIIVNTFSELRDEKWRIDKNMKRKCFICCIARCEFKKRAKGFHHHVMHEHCMWDYIYFYFHLKKIDTSDHNPIEKYVYEQIKHDKIDFFPLSCSKSLKVTSDQILPRLDRLEKMVAEIKEYFQYEEILSILHKKREEQAQWERDHTNNNQ